MIGSWTELMWLGESSLWMMWLHLLDLCCSLFPLTWKSDANKHAMYSISSITGDFWLSLNTWPDVLMGYMLFDIMTLYAMASLFSDFLWFATRQSWFAKWSLTLTLFKHNLRFVCAVYWEEIAGIYPYFLNLFVLA